MKLVLRGLFFPRSGNLCVRNIKENVHLEHQP